MPTKVHIGARIEPELRQNIEAAAERNGLTISEQVSSMLAQEETNYLTIEDVRQIVQEELDQRQTLYNDDTDDFEELVIDTLLPKYLRQEVFAMIEDAFDQIELAEDDPLFLPAFLNQLADEADGFAAGPSQRVLEEETALQIEDEVLWKIDDVIDSVINEMEEDYSRESFLTTFAMLFRETADQYYSQARAIQLSFSMEEWEQLDLMLELVNKNRSENKRFTDLKTFLKWKLGRVLKDQADERLFGGYEYPRMAELGKTLQIIDMA